MELFQGKYPIIAEHGDYHLVLLDGMQFAIFRKTRPITYHATTKSALAYWIASVGAVSAAQDAASALNGLDHAREYAALHAVFQGMSSGGDK